MGREKKGPQPVFPTQKKEPEKHPKEEHPKEEQDDEQESIQIVEDSQEIDVYGALLKKKKKEIKVTFELDEDVVKLLHKLANKFPHGFKKTFANNAIKNEAKRVAELHNIKL